MALDVLRPRRDLTTLVMVVAVVALALRFVGLSDAPPGFHVDESVAGANIVCLAETGADAQGNPWPLNSVWSSSSGAVVYPASLLYPGVVWVNVVGDSVASLRALGVAASLALVLATAAVAFNFFGRPGFAWALLIGAVMPWTWDLGRTFLAAGGMVGRAALMVAIYVLTRDRATRPVGSVAGAVAGIGFATALGYNGTRAVAVAMGLLLVIALLRRGLIPFRSLMFMLAGGVIAAVPVLSLLGGNQLLERTSNVSILNSGWLEESGTTGVVGIALAFVRHLGLHLSPSFLFINGDGQLRHNSGITGQMGWLELLLTLLIPVAIWLAWRSTRRPVPANYLLMVGVGVFTGLATAALSTSMLPHAQRSLTAVPFIVLGLTAVAVVITQHWATFPALAVAVAVIFGAWFLPQYFNEFPQASVENFETFIRASADRAARNGDMGPFVDEFRSWTPPEAFIYFSAAAENGRGCPGVTSTAGT